MHAFLALMKKDFLVFFNDRRALIMSFIAPILIGSFFGYVFGGISNRDNAGKTSVIAVDMEHTDVSKDIIEKLTAEKTLNVKSGTLDEARDLVRKGKVPVAVVIPAGFDLQTAKSLFGSAPKPALEILVDPSHTIEAAMISGMLTGHVMQALTKSAISGSLRATIAFQSMNAARTLPSGQQDALRMILSQAGKLTPSNDSRDGFSMPFTSVQEQLTSRRGVAYNPYAHSFGGMAIQFILFMGIDVGVGLLLQRQLGLWKRFRAAPLSKSQLLGSRAISAMLMSTLVLAVVFTFARIVFGVRIEGSLLGFMAVCAAFGLMTATYGLLIAALAKTPEAARGLSVLATIVMVMLSGAWVPSFLFPAWLQSATKVVPARWAMDGMDAMSWRGLPLSEAVAPVLVLLGFSALFGTIAVLRFRWECE